MHVRRNDFQFKEMWLSAEQMTANSAELFEPSEQVYIATDERSAPGHQLNFDPNLISVQAEKAPPPRQGTAHLLLFSR